MKSFCKKLMVYVITTALIIGSIAFVSPSDTAFAATKKKTLPKISISKTSVFLLKGQSTTLKVKKAKGKVVWKSSKKSVVKVKNGKITALKAGKAVISVRANKQTKKCVVTVEAPSISDTTLDLEVEDEDTLELEGCTHKASWKSSNPSVVSVNNGQLVANSAGTAVISATVHGATFSCTITVTDSSEDEDDEDDDEDSDDDSEDDDSEDDDSEDDSDEEV